jgi:hypothetical protein
MERKVGEQGLVRELPKLGAIISHDVVGPLEVRQAGKIAVVALVKCPEA